MKHVPHLVVGAPWGDGDLDLSIVQWRHVTKVLRLKRGDAVTYTDGLGTVGSGSLGDQSVSRGPEERQERGVELHVAAAPPASKDRQRFLVEKLAELGVARLRWLDTVHGKNRVASPPKVFAWVRGAVEQSRGAWLMETSPEFVTWPELESPVVVCHPGGESGRVHARTVAIGPEGGFAEGEIPSGLGLWDLGANILRVETAAVVACARLLG